MANEQPPTDSNDLSRRQFVTLSVAAGLAAAAGTQVGAQAKVVETDVQVKTQDGTCDAALIHPASGTYPGVIIWPDAFGLRPAMRDNGEAAGRGRLHGTRSESVLPRDQSAGRQDGRLQLPERRQHGGTS